MNYNREQVFWFSRARHQFNHVLKTGVKKDGTLLALQNECYLEGGAYASFGIATVYYAGSLLGAPYKLPNMKYDGYRVYTNKPACGAQRGHGGVAARAAFEQQLDAIAEELGMDPIDLRLKNIMESGDVTCNDLNMSSLGMKECIEAVRDGSVWKDKKGKVAQRQGHRDGLRVLCLGCRLSHLPVRHLSLHGHDQAGRRRRHGTRVHRIGGDRSGVGHDHGHDRGRGPGGPSRCRAGVIRRHGLRDRPGGLLQPHDPHDGPCHQGGGRRCQKPGAGGAGLGAEGACRRIWTSSGA